MKTTLMTFLALALFAADADAGILGRRGGGGGGGGGCNSGGCGQQRQVALQAGVPVPVRQNGQPVLLQRGQFVGTQVGAQTCTDGVCNVSANACGTGGCAPRGVRIAQNSGQCGRN
jgi:hypothetical protein